MTTPGWGEPVVELLEAFFEAIERVPVAGYQHQHRKLGAERGHAAFLDIAAAIEDDFGDILNDASTVRTNC